MRPMSKNMLSVLALAAGLGLGSSVAWAQATPSDDSSGAAGASAASTMDNTPPAPPPKPYYGGIEVAKGQGTLVKLPSAVANLFIADSTVAQARPTTPGTMFVFGKAVGETDIVATDADGNRIAQYQVTVDPSNYAGDHLQSVAAQGAPSSNVHVENETSGVVVSGAVDSAEQAASVIERAKLASGGGTVVNDLSVNEPVQVELKVRIAQMSRNVSRELGIDWGAATSAGFAVGKFALTGQTGSAGSSLSSDTQGQLGVLFPGGTFEGVIDALAADNLAHVIAEPTLTTLSGTQASFQVGGQFPIPVAAVNSAGGTSVTVEFKNYGVLLTFTPTVFSDGRIALQVAPELSSISTANSAVLSTSGSSTALAVPSLNVTNASSTVILGSGQGMAIAGLLEDTTNQQDNGVPGLSEVPLLGSLFRGDAFQREQQELVITVTPYIVQPVNNPNSLASPDDGWTPPNDLQRILLLRDNGAQTATTAIPGDAGFMVQ